MDAKLEWEMDVEGIADMMVVKIECRHRRVARAASNKPTYKYYYCTRIYA